MQLLIYEPNHSGHRLNYVRLLVQALQEFEFPITVVLGKGASQTKEFEVQLQPYASLFQYEAVLDVGPGANETTNPAMFLETLKQFSPDHVYIPYADVLAQNLAISRFKNRWSWPKSTEVEALMMRGGFAYPSANFQQRLKANLSWRLATSVPWTVLHHLDPLVFEALKHKGQKPPANLRLMPDPVDPTPHLDVTQARRLLGLPLEGRFIGSAGALDERKGIDLLVDAFMAQPRQPKDRLILAGRMSPHVRNCVEKAQRSNGGAENIIVLDRYLSNEELDTALCALDVVCTPYPRHIGSASFVIRAVAAKRPVLSSDFGWSGYVVPRFSLGKCCNVLDREGFAQAIGVALDEAKGYQPNEKARHFREFHTSGNFAAHWTRRLRQRLGQTPLDEGVSSSSLFSGEDVVYFDRY